MQYFQGIFFISVTKLFLATGHVINRDSMDQLITHDITGSNTHLHELTLLRRVRRELNMTELTNGCSTYTSYAPFKEEFTPACNKHDICYQCATTRGKDQEYCDEKFERDINDYCIQEYYQKQYYWWYYECLAAKVVYYNAVANFGKPHFNTTEHHICNHVEVQLHIFEGNR